MQRELKFRAWDDVRKVMVVQLEGCSFPCRTIISTKYSADYLKLIFNFFSLFEKSPRISIKKDYPMSVENDDFTIVLAPRVEND